jgi:hypothetical protein
VKLRAFCHALVLLALLCISGARALAQPLRITATAPLDFQTLSPNSTRTVGSTSGQAATFTIQGLANATIQILAVTPDRLIGPTQFVSTSGWTTTIITQFGVAQNAAPLVAGSEIGVTLGPDGLATMRIGGTIAPPMTVGSGTFAGVITLVARDPSNGLMSLTSQAAVSASIRQPLILTSVPMEFGPVFVNTPKTLSPSNVNAFRMLVDGAFGASVDVTLESVPTALTRIGFTDQLSIGTWRAQHGGATCTGSQITPTVGAAVALDLNAAIGGGGRTSYCLGATVSPTALQPSGNYTGTVVISVKYTGA